MRISQLKTFVAVADAGSFSAAARKLFATQPALTQQLNALEQQTGFRLLERDHKGVRLTPAGEIFYQSAKEIIAIANSGLARARTLANVSGGTLRVGYPSEPLNLLLQNVCNLMHERHPHIRLEIVQVFIADQFDALEEKRIDVLATSGSALIAQKGLVFTEVAQSCEYCGIPVHHRLYGKEQITFEDLYDEAVLFPPVGMFESADKLRTFMNELHPRIHTLSLSQEDYKSSTINIRSNLNNHILMTSGEFYHNPTPMHVAPLDWSGRISLGVAHAPKPTEAVLAFIDAAREVYSAHFPE